MSSLQRNCEFGLHIFPSVCWINCTHAKVIQKILIQGFLLYTGAEQNKMTITVIQLKSKLIKWDFEVIGLSTGYFRLVSKQDPLDQNIFPHERPKMLKFQGFSFSSLGSIIKIL